MTLVSPAPAILVFLAGATSLAWGWWYHDAYWTALSALALGWAIWLRSDLKAATAVPVFGPLMIIPVAVVIAGVNDLTNIVESVTAPIIIYFLCLFSIPSFGASAGSGYRKMVLFASLMAAVTVGCLLLLSLYYVGAVLSVPLLKTNADLMWPLAFLFMEAPLITILVGRSGLAAGSAEEVSG